MLLWLLVFLLASMVKEVFVSSVVAKTETSLAGLTL